MSHTNSTSNYNLPQFITTDKPAWLTDVNNAYSVIDLGIKAAKDAGDNAQSDATQALTDAGNAQTTANNASAAANGAVASISETFLDSSTYNVGDLVIYNNLLYRCHTAVNVPGAWTGSSNWSRTDIDTQLSSIYGNTISMSSTDPEKVSNRITALESAIPTEIQDLTNVVFGTLSGGQVLTIESGTGNVINSFPAVRWAGNFDNIGHTNWVSGVYLYSYESNSTSAPSTTGGYAMSFFNADNNKYGCQVAFSNGGLYYRKLSNNVYGSWTTLA